MTQTRAIDVVGGGVAGLAVAAALAGAGREPGEGLDAGQNGGKPDPGDGRRFAVTVHERAAALSDIGAGLQVSPNGMRVIDALGLGASLRRVSLPARAVVLRDRAGRRVLRLPLAGDYRLVHRARLIDVLAAGVRAAGAEIRLGAALSPADGAGRLRLAADGLRSAHRAVLNGPAAPQFTRQVAWRAVIPDAEAGDGGGAGGEVEVFMGPGRHLVSYPLAGGLRNIVAVEERADWTAEGWHHRADPAQVAHAFAGFGGPVADWLRRIGEVHLWGLFRHPVAARWQGEGLVLLGDAAHPMLPFLAQGANMALEDAWTLARVLTAGDDPATYQRLREARVARVVAAATGNARNYHLTGARAVAAHGLLRIADRVAPGLVTRRFAWLYDHDPTAA